MTQPTPKPNRGGRRNGAGRKRLPPEQARSEVASAKVAPYIKEFADAQPCGASDFINTLLIKAYKKVE